jgi:hypothetical protein
VTVESGGGAVRYAAVEHATRQACSLEERLTMAAVLGRELRRLGGAAVVAWVLAEVIWAEIYLGEVCSCYERLRPQRPRSGGGGSAAPPPPLFVDSMANAASCAFGALPERLAIVGGDGVVEFIGGRGPEVIHAYFLIRTEAVAEIPLRFYSFRIRCLS